MLYIKVNDGIPKSYSIDELIKDNPQVSFPNSFSKETLEEYGVFTLAETPRPNVNKSTHKVIEKQPQFVDGVWTQAWDIVELTEGEKLQLMQNLKIQIADHVQRRLDKCARNREYDNILSLCSYATSKFPRFQVEGQIGVDLRDQTWAKLYEILAEVEAGIRPAPTSYDDIESELPPLPW